jgi:sugar phosphate isomerase/epimerase
MDGSPEEPERSAAGRLDRRGFLVAGASGAAAVGLGLAGCGGGDESGAAGGGDRGREAAGSAPGDRPALADAGLIPRERRAIQLYTVRDALARDPAAYPTQPSGFRAVFAALAGLGYGAVEGFDSDGAPFRQHPAAEGGATPSPRLVKRWLDESGLIAAGHYGKIDPRTIEATLDLAEALETPIVGSVDPIPYPCSNQKDDWDVAIAAWNACAKRAESRGIPIYAHAHWRPWDFLRDSGRADARGRRDRSSGIRSIEYWLDRTDPKWVRLEMDTYWAYVARSLYAEYTAPDGSRRRAEFDPLATALKHLDRCPIFHAKDGIAAAAPPPGFEGDYVWAPFGAGELPLRRFFGTVLGQASGPPPFVAVEQDNAPAASGGSLAEPIEDPGKSLRDATTGLRGLATI